MAIAAINLGCGRPGNDPASKELLDVHLHLDFPATPISMGESWGSAPSTGASYTLQDAVAHRHWAHLEACGCDWLIQVALEEKGQGRLFTPQEILERRPQPKPTPAVAPARSKPAPAGTLERIRKAIAAADYEAIEGLRDVLNDELVLALAAEWRPDLPWKVKDAYAALLMDQTAACVRPIYQDALASPTTESRAYAVCVLSGDFGVFDSLLTDGGVDEAKVDAAVARLKS